MDQELEAGTNFGPRLITTKMWVTVLNSIYPLPMPVTPDFVQYVFDFVDGEKCRTMHYQPKQPKTLPVLNRGGAGYETEADLCIKLNRQLIPFQTHRLVAGTQTGHRHPNWLQAPKFQNQTR